MIGTMRKHSTWLWGIIIIVVIFAFVIWGTNPGSQGGGPTGRYGQINGKTLTEGDIVRARAEVDLRYFLQRAEWPGAEAARLGFDVNREIYMLLLLIQKLEERNIHAGPEAKAAVIANMLQGLKSRGVNTLAEFEAAILTDRGLTLADLDRFMEHQIAMRQLTAVEGISGQLITPQQLQSLWERENQEVSAQVAFCSASKYLDSVDVTPEAVGAFFTNQMARYRLPERVQVSYVAYPISNYLAQADEKLASVVDLDAQIESVYSQRGTNYYADVTPDEAREQIRAEFRKRAAAFAASQDAAGFASELWRQEPMKSSDMERIGTQRGLSLKVTEPFDRTSTPEGLDVNSLFTDTAFRLREDEPFAGPIEGDDHLYVITLNQRIPSANAEFEDVKDAVTEDYRLQQATLKARELGQAFANDLTNSLASGKAFTEICAEAGFDSQLLPPVAQSTRSLPEVEEHTSLGLFKQIAFATPVGEASRFNFTSDGGYVVYVGAHLALDEAKMKEEMPRYAQYVRQALEGEAFNIWFGQEAQVGLSKTPLASSPNPEVSAPGS